MLGFIFLWSGAIVDIPVGWQICDGTNGTPNLKNMLIVGAGDSYYPNDAFGNQTHTHSFTGDGHDHWAGIFPPELIPSGTFFNGDWDSAPVVGDTDPEPTAPPYYALVYIGWVGQ